jgi:hypothetical protein
MNYGEGRAYSHAFAGKDYNDRSRIKRKVERWRAKYAALPLLRGWQLWRRSMRLTPVKHSLSESARFWCKITRTFAQFF